MDRADRWLHVVSNASRKKQKKNCKGSCRRKRRGSVGERNGTQGSVLKSDDLAVDTTAVGALIKSARQGHQFRDLRFESGEREKKN